MSYTPINWQTGDTITAEKLNKMDNGWLVFVVNLITDESSTRFDKTWQEVYDAADAGALVLLRQKVDGELLYNSWVTDIANESSSYAVYVHSFVANSEIEYETNAASGYPATQS